MNCVTRKLFPAYANNKAAQSDHRIRFKISFQSPVIDVKMINFRLKKKDFFLLIFTQNIDRVYTFIEPPQPRHSLSKSVVSPRLPEFSQY